MNSVSPLLCKKKVLHNVCIIFHTINLRLVPQPRVFPARGRAGGKPLSGTVVVHV